MSALVFQAVVHRLSRIEAQLARLMDQIKPWVHQTVQASEERAMAFVLSVMD